MPWSIVFHPAFQSLLLPALLGGLCTLVLLRTLGRANPSWGALGASFGLVLAMLWWPGFVWPATAHAQKLPWIVLTGLVAAVAAQTYLLGRSVTPGRTTLAAGRSTRARGALWALSVLVLLLPGLAFFAVAAGSLLLAQLALMVAASAGVPLLWAWVRPGSGPRITAVSLIPLVAALMALLVMVAALGPVQAPGTGADDPYYTPRW